MGANIMCSLDTRIFITFNPGYAVEISTFGSKFIALRIAVENFIVLRYNIRMFGIPLDGPA